jgi:hypothetical protein
MTAIENNQKEAVVENDYIERLITAACIGVGKTGRDEIVSPLLRKKAVELLEITLWFGAILDIEELPQAAIDPSGIDPYNAIRDATEKLYLNEAFNYEARVRDLFNIQKLLAIADGARTPEGREFLSKISARDQ